MSNPIESLIDGSYLLPSERLTPDNLSLLQRNSGDVQDISTYMNTVRTAMLNYQQGFTGKIALNPADIQAYISRIRRVTACIGGGYDEDGVTVITPLAANIIPDMLMTLRANQLYLCQLYALYQDSNGDLIGPPDKLQIENAVTGGGNV